MSVVDLNPDKAQCRLFARGGTRSHAFGAAGSARFVATATAVDAIGSAISTGIQQSADFDDCMISRGWQVVDATADTAPPIPAPAFQADAVASDRPRAVASLGIQEPLRKPFGVRANVMDDTLAASLQINPLRGGIIILDVIREGAAWKGGIQPGDVLLTFDEQEVMNVTDLRRDLTNISAGNIVLAKVWRAGKVVPLQFRF